jgi:hypothetical protein
MTVTLAGVETALAVAVSWVGNPLSMWLAINRKPFGWWIVAVTQAAFCGFAVLGHHWEFGGQALCLVMGCYGVWKWQIRRSHEPAIGQAAEQVTEQPEKPAPDPWANSRLIENGQVNGTATRLPIPGQGGPLPFVGLGSGPRPLPSPAPVPPQRAALAAETARTESIRPGAPRQLTATRVDEGPAWERLVVAQDAIAALNHFDRQAAQSLQDRLEETR